MIEQNTRRTKIIKSFEGAALKAQEADRVIKEEVDVLRLVYEKPAVPLILDFLANLRDRQKDVPRLPIMLDLATADQGAIFGLKEPRELAFGERLHLSPQGGGGDLEVESDQWDRLFVAGATVFLGYGNVALRVVTIHATKIEVEVSQGGTVFPEMDVFIPETRKDPDRMRVSVAELETLLRAGLDYLIVPGQWAAAEIAAFRAGLKDVCGNATPWLIVKLDSGETYERLEELVPVVEGVLISRREMALTVNPATVPMMTKEVIQMCSDSAKIVVTASEMLASMRRNATPTRAEVSDVANAVIDGTDAVVLSEEVANGKYGANAVAVMHRIITDVEAKQYVKPNWIKLTPAVTSEMDAISYGAYKTAQRIRAKALVCITKAGNTALKLASFRPPVPVIAVTFSADVMRRLAIIRGVEGILLDIDPNIDEVLPMVNDHLVRESWLKPGDPIIFVSVSLSSVGRESSNLFTIQEVS